MKLQQREELNYSTLINKTYFKEKNFPNTLPYNEPETSNLTINKSQRSQSRDYNFAPYRIRMRRNFRTPVKSTYPRFLKNVTDYTRVKDTFYIEKKENDKYLKLNKIESCRANSVYSAEENVEQKLKLTERVNRVLFFKNKQLEKRIAELSKATKYEVNKIEDNVNALEMNKQSKEQSNEYIELLKYRIEELNNELKACNDKYKALNEEYSKLIAKLVNDKIYSTKQVKEIVNNYQNIIKEDDKSEKESYKKRFAELEATVHTLANKKDEYEKKFNDLQQRLKEKQMQEDKIEKYVNVLIKAHKNIKSDIMNVLELSKENKVIPKNYYEKYTSTNESLY